MSDPIGLAARVVRRVHPGLTLDIDLRVGDECVVLFGESGAGKTSLLRAIAGLDRPDSGQMGLDGRAILDSEAGVRLPLRRRAIGLVDQHHQLFPHLDVAGNVRFGLGGWSAADRRRRLEEVAALCGIGRLLSRRIANLSGGERQRVAVARSLAPRPRLLLCDEPFSALDLPARTALADMLRGVRRSERLPTLFVTHSPTEAVAVGDRLLVLEGGRIVDQGAPLDVLASRWPGEGPALDLLNVLPGVVVGDEPGRTASLIQLLGGPVLVVPHHSHRPGAVVLVLVPAEELIVAAGPAAAAGLSARNVLGGVVDRVVPHGSEAEVVVRTGAVRWMVSVVADAVAALGLRPGADCSLVAKARSCRVIARHEAGAGPT